MRIRDALMMLVQRASVRLLAVSLAGWILMLILEREVQASSLCLSNATLSVVSSSSTVTVFAADPPALVMLSWLAMLLAMMSPLLTRPIAHIRLHSLTRRRAGAVAFFVSGYGMIWMVAGVVLLTASVELQIFAHMAGVPVLMIAAAIVIAWQTTALRQHALIRCHRLPCLSAFGGEASLDCIRFGLTHGFWCIVTCAPLMLLPLAAPEIHLPLMAALSAGLLLERLAPVRQPSWNLQILPGQAVFTILARSIHWSVR